MPLPAPPPDVAERVARLWTAIEVALPHDGTAADALREGLHTLAAADIDVREDAVVLLPALYSALVARGDETFDEIGERAQAWALGLADDSPLVPVVDVMLVAPGRGIDVNAALGHLFGVPAFDEPVRTVDRRFITDPGTALQELAFELGHRQVISRDDKTLRIGPASEDVLRAQIRAFEQKFGRPPGPQDPIFFDPDADEPRPMRRTEMERVHTTMLDAAGICGAWIYAYQHTNGLLPAPDGTFNSETDRSEWQEAVDRYRRTHTDEIVDDTIELAKLRGMLVAASLSHAGHDPEVGASLARRLDAVDDDPDNETSVVAEFLRANAAELTRHLHRSGVGQAAAELGRARGGATLADRVQQTATTSGATAADLPVLLTAAVVTLGTPSE